MPHAKRSPTPTPAGFDFHLHVRRLCADLCGRLRELAHVDMSRVAIRGCKARRPGRHGVHASLTPLRFEGGALVTRRHGRTWTVERLFDESGREILYLLSFYLPRFLEQPRCEKLATVVHELWHIGPAFDGDLRRHSGRCFAHTRSKDHFDAQMHALAEKWLALSPPSATFAFLELDYRGLVRRFGGVHAPRIRTPKLVPLGEPARSC